MTSSWVAIPLAGRICFRIRTAMMGQHLSTALRDGVFAQPTLAEAGNN